MPEFMISAPQPEAVEAGLDIFKRGGNVVDAAIAAAMVQTVVDPQMCGIAGFGSMQLLLKERKEHLFIDFHGKAPKAVSQDMWESLVDRECDDGFGFVLKDKVNEIGYKSMTTPMTLKAFDKAVQSYGRLSLEHIMQPAINYCFDGFQVRPAVHRFWLQPAQAGRIERVEVIKKFKTARDIYLKNDKLLNVGDNLKNLDMGRLYEKIANEGVDIFYKGDVAEIIDADMKANGGLITKADLADCEPNLTAPLLGTYRDCEIATNQMPGGGLMIIEMLNILENFDLKSMGHNSAEYIACVAEAMKCATVDKDTLMGDQNYLDVPVKKLSSKGYAATIASKIFTGEKFDVPRVNSGMQESKETTHLVAADKKGNIVNLTHSLGSSSGVITEGLGFMYNNCMMVFDPRPGKPGSLAPGKSRFTAMCPTVISHNGEPKLALGAPGGTTITMGVLQTILNVVDFNMNAQHAVTAPRFCATSNLLELTNRIFRSVEAELIAKNYATIRYPSSYITPLVHAIRFANGTMDGGADPAGDGMFASV